jgi:glutamate carboxypeptidase
MLHQSDRRHSRWEQRHPELFVVEPLELPPDRIAMAFERSEQALLLAAEGGTILDTLRPWLGRRMRGRGLYGDPVADLDLLIADLRTLVEVESPSLELAALGRSANALAALMEERTGIGPEIVDGPAGPHVHWRGGGDPKVLILGHHDTVFPLGALTDRPFSVADGRATGPGVFDMKAGIVQALHAVAALDDASGVEMLFTADEEIGSGSSRALLEERARACGNVLVLEPSADGGAVKTGRKGCGTFEVVVHGRASHAGLEPEQGINSLIEASHQVIRIASFADADAGTTVTPTVARAGTADNVVPAETRIKVDCRVESAAEKARVEDLMANLVPVVAGASITVNGSIGRPPMPESASATLFPLAEAAMPGVVGVSVGGGSDGNFTAALGVPTLDGLGAVGGGAHADHEHVIVDTMPGRVDLLVGILRRLL